MKLIPTPLDGRLVAAGLLSALVVTSAPAADAASHNWYSRSNPLKAWEDDVAQALGYGTSYTKDGYLKNHTFYRDPRSGGDKVYTETGYTYREPDRDGGESWSGSGDSDQSARNSSGDWVDQYDQDDYSEHNSADQGRIHSKVCEDQAWSPDACSRRPYFTFNL
jgi:hypothetical protein